MRNLEFFIVRKEECICPECKSLLEHRDIVPGIQRYTDKEPQWFKIERRQCINESCRRIHRVLPDEMVKFKHYSAETITEEDPFDLTQESSTRSRMPCSLK